MRKWYNARMSDATKPVHLTVFLDADTHLRLRQQSVLRRTSMQKLVEAWIKEGLVALESQALGRERKEGERA